MLQGFRHGHAYGRVQVQEVGQKLLTVSRGGLPDEAITLISKLLQLDAFHQQRLLGWFAAAAATAAARWLFLLVIDLSKKAKIQNHADTPHVGGCGRNLRGSVVQQFGRAVAIVGAGHRAAS